MTDTVLGTRLRKIREQHGISQRELAQRCEIGIRQIYRYENDKGEPSAGHLAKIARELSVSTDYLLGLVDEPVQQHLGEPLSEYEHRIVEHVREHDINGVMEVWLELSKDRVERAVEKVTHLRLRFLPRSDADVKPKRKIFKPDHIEVVPETVYVVKNAQDPTDNLLSSPETARRLAEALPDIAKKDPLSIMKIMEELPPEQHSEIPH